MYYNHKYFIILILILSAPFFMGADTKNKTIKPTSPVKIQANEMRYYGTERKSTFHGNVVAVSDNYTLTSDDIVVFLNKDMDVSKIQCTGNVNFKSDDIVSISKRADLDHNKKVAVITGDVKVWQGENYLEGEKVFIYYEEERIVVDKGTEKRVTIIFKPENEGKK
ncbi:lipopolysaccharide transport periplasmic protein LptA [Mucispirillum schaedleri]|uniref:lipopolysaccharide transport periplasmic protein LptA n=1 Tax=Mucispirillum schaedleri TaxID=248039 RepID=UPI001F5AD7D1|nr:lipopolysaccharide transport periplasmic protein LptA [Mucispirillum schaedleri]